jgi:phosphoadenosine phosphosulfate reductase
LSLLMTERFAAEVLSLKSPKMKLSDLDLKKLNDAFDKKSAQDVLKSTFKNFDSVTLASSFGLEDVALIHMALAVKPSVRIFTLDTGRLHDETYRVMEEIKKRYGITIDVFFPDTQKVESLVKKKGFYSFKESVANRKECCGIRKVEPLKRALDGFEVWVTGLRREQAMTRTQIKKIERDPNHPGMLKVNPIADWSEERVTGYIKENNIPYNKLHDVGFRSIGCAPCTRAVKPGEDIRAGRWWWEQSTQKECGLH